MSRFVSVPLALGLLALGLAACGGDEPPSKAEFAEQAEAICRDTEKRLANVGEDASSPEQVANAVDTVIEETRGSVDELKELDLPDGEAGQQAEDFVNALEREVTGKGIPALEDLRDALKEGDQQAAQDAAQQLQELESSGSDKLARELGASACV